jgi:hypothetical protein
MAAHGRRIAVDRQSKYQAAAIRLDAQAVF